MTFEPAPIYEISGSNAVAIFVRAHKHVEIGQLFGCGKTFDGRILRQQRYCADSLRKSDLYPSVSFLAVFTQSSVSDKVGLIVLTRMLSAV